MGFRDLIPWSRNQELVPTRESFDPFITFHREMNRLFDDVFNGFGALGRTGSPLMEGRFGWPKIELSETDKALTVSAELPGLTEKDVQVEIAHGVLRLRARKRPSERTTGSTFPNASTVRSSGKSRSTASWKRRPKRHFGTAY